jgi:vanillate O-demethylase monooxygenase subunit
MRYLKNTWYVAAWAHEVAADRPFPRKLFGEAVVFFRRRDGSVAAIADYCPHRFAPLHRGRLMDDTLECGYHGLRFDGTGACVHNPHGSGIIPAGCEVRGYPVVERHGIVWIWPGDADKADAAAIADFAYLDSPGRKTVFGLAHVKANYELISDNLMDASHTQYVHMDLLGTDTFARSRHEVLQDGPAVHSNYLIPATVIPAAYEAYFPDPSVRVDYSVNFRWLPPSLVRNSVSLIPVDQGAEHGVLRTGSHFMTPETAMTTHYFFSHTRNFSLDDEEVDERIRWWQKTGLTEQDGGMIEAVQRVMGTPELDALKPLLLSIDSAAVRVRRMLSRLIDAESEAVSAGALSA